MALTASPTAGAPSSITPQRAMNPSPIFAITTGIRLATPETITVREETIAAVPPTPAAANAASPAAIAASPTPTPRTATPISTNVPPRAKRTGIRGASAIPATPITANAPASTISPFTIAPQLIAPKRPITGASTANAAAATINAAAPFNVPFIKFSPIASSARLAPMAARPFPICSQEKPANFPITSAMIFRASPTMIRPAPILTMPLGIILAATATPANEPPIAASPFPISSQDILPNFLATETNIFIAAPTNANETPIDTMRFVFPASFVNSASSVSKAPTPASPFPISSQDIAAKSPQTDASILSAADRITIPVAVDMAFPLNFAVFRKNETSAKSTPTPARPLPSSSQLKPDKSSQAPARTRTATASTTRLPAPLMAVFPPRPIILAAATIVPVSPMIPAIPTASPSMSSPLSFFNAEAIIRTDNEIATIAEIVLDIPNRLPPSLVTTAIAAIRSVNIAVITPVDVSSLSPSIRDKTRTAPARTAIAPAIFSNTSAFSCA